MSKKGLREKLSRFRKKKESSSIIESAEALHQFSSPPKGKPLIRIFKEKENKDGILLIEQVGGFIDFCITDNEKLVDYLIKQLSKGYYVKVDNLE